MIPRPFNFEQIYTGLQAGKLKHLTACVQDGPATE
jgi:hypothetical protein